MDSNTVYQLLLNTSVKTYALSHHSTQCDSEYTSDTHSVADHSNIHTHPLIYERYMEAKHLPLPPTELSTPPPTPSDSGASSEPRDGITSDSSPEFETSSISDSTPTLSYIPPQPTRPPPPIPTQQDTTTPPSSRSSTPTPSTTNQENPSRSTVFIMPEYIANLDVHTYARKPFHAICGTTTNDTTTTGSKAKQPTSQEPRRDSGLALTAEGKDESPSNQGRQDMHVCIPEVGGEMGQVDVTPVTVTRAGSVSGSGVEGEGKVEGKERQGRGKKRWGWGKVLGGCFRGA